MALYGSTNREYNTEMVSSLLCVNRLWVACPSSNRNNTCFRFLFWATNPADASTVWFNLIEVFSVLLNHT